MSYIFSIWSTYSELVYNHCTGIHCSLDFVTTLFNFLLFVLFWADMFAFMIVYKELQIKEQNNFLRHCPLVDLC